MKVSTKIKKYVSPELIYGTGKYADYNSDYTFRKIVLMVDCKRTEYESYSLSMIDKYDRYFRKDEKYKLLPLNECPVVNDTEIIMHYTSTDYKTWCNS